MARHINPVRADGLRGIIAITRLGRLDQREGIYDIVKRKDIEHAIIVQIKIVIKGPGKTAYQHESNVVAVFEVQKSNKIRDSDGHGGLADQKEAVR